MIRLTDISLSYGSRTILRDISLHLHSGELCALIGRNGAGKSTFLNLMTGYLQPEKGKIERGETLRIGYYRQQGMDFKAGQTVFDIVHDIAETIEASDGHSVSATTMLNRFLFPPDTHNKRVEILSGGEQRRLYLLTVLMRNPNFLILDEPTNDLDILTLNVLEEYLMAFKGCLLIVSHDRYFLDKVVDRIFGFEGNGVLRQYEGGYSDYLEVKQREDQTETVIEKTAKAASEKTEKVKTTKLKFTWQEQKDYETIEDVIAGIEDKIVDLEKQIERSATDFVKLNQLSKEKEEQEALLEEKMERYLYLSDLADRIAGQ